MCIWVYSYAMTCTADKTPTHKIKPMATPASIEVAHTTLTRLAATQGCSDPELSAGVSRHALPATTSFSILGTLHEEATKGFTADFIGAQNGKLVYSAREKPLTKLATRKRAREVEGLEESADKLLAKLGTSLSAHDADAARTVLVRLKRDLKGSQDEAVVLSLGVELRKLHASDSQQRMVIIARLAPGVAVSVGRLKSVLGDAWADGAVSVGTSACGVGGDLPKTEEEEAAARLGAPGMLLVTSVRPIDATPG